MSCYHLADDASPSGDGGHPSGKRPHHDFIFVWSFKSKNQPLPSVDDFLWILGLGLRQGALACMKKHYSINKAFPSIDDHQRFLFIEDGHLFSQLLHATCPIYRLAIAISNSEKYFLSHWYPSLHWCCLSRPSLLLCSQELVRKFSKSSYSLQLFPVSSIEDISSDESWKSCLNKQPPVSINFE